MGRICKVDGCGRVHYANDYCEGHYKRERAGRPVDGPLEPRPRRKKDPSRAYTGRKIDKKGYVLIYRPGHPNAQASGWLYEHVYVMAEVAGRPLDPGERVHHRNGVRGDNREENLELWAIIPQPPGQRVDELVKWAVSVLRRYEPWRLR